MDNIAIREFSNAIREFTRKSALPAEVKRLALAELLRETEREAQASLMAEIAERDRKEGQDGAESVQ